MLPARRTAKRYIGDTIARMMTWNMTSPLLVRIAVVGEVEEPKSACLSLVEDSYSVVIGINQFAIANAVPF